MEVQIACKENYSKIFKALTNKTILCSSFFARALLWNWDSILGYSLGLIGFDRYRLKEVELEFNIKIRNVREHQGLKNGKCPIFLTVGNICEPFDSNSYDESLLSSYTTDWAWISTSKKEHVFFTCVKKGLQKQTRVSLNIVHKENSSSFSKFNFSP